MTIERCKVCEREQDGGAGCFTSEEGVCADCYEKLAQGLSDLLERYGEATVIGTLEAACDALADHAQGGPAEGYARRASIHFGQARARLAAMPTDPNVATFSDAMRVLGSS